MGPNYANLFVGYVEEQIFNQFDGPKYQNFLAATIPMIVLGCHILHQQKNWNDLSVLSTLSILAPQIHMSENL